MPQPAPTAPAVETPERPKTPATVTEPFRTWRIVVVSESGERTGRVLRTGFSAPAPRFGVEPDDAADFPCYETANRIARKLESSMNARLKAMNMPPSCALDVIEAQWEGQSFVWWEALQRMDRTSIETGRFEAMVLPGFMRAKS